MKTFREKLDGKQKKVGMPKGTPPRRGIGMPKDAPKRKTPRLSRRVR